MTTPMTTPSKNELESRLTQALSARADQVGPTDLGPGFAPHASPPWWARLGPAYVGGGVLLAAAAAVVVIAVVGNGDDSSRPLEPTGPSTATDVPTPTEPTTDPDPTTGELPALLPQDRIAWSRDREPVAYDDGSTATVTGTEIVITADGTTSRGTLPLDAEGGVAPFLLQLGQAGVGYLVNQGGGETSQWSVVLPDGAGIVLAAPQGDVPFGSEYGLDALVHETWSTGDGSAIYTRLNLDSRQDGADVFQVFGWEVTGPGEGGGADAPVELRSTDLGVVCFNLDAGTYERCALDTS